MRTQCAGSEVQYEGIGAHITCAVCYFNSCQTAGAAFERLPAAPTVFEPDGGTAYVLFRKDRINCIRGRESLKEQRCINDCCTADFGLKSGDFRKERTKHGRSPTDTPCFHNASFVNTSQHVRRDTRFISYAFPRLIFAVVLDTIELVPPR
jgi:hypothetical protein